jgi:uncharacterized Ntn-hydrolase superfamily protein
MTFSIAGYCERTGMSGIAITTSSICVGSRCPWVRAGAGAVATQNITDPRIGIEVLDLMSSGLSAKTALDAVTKDRPNIDYRQIIVVDLNGSTAHFAGSHTLRTNSIAEGTNCVAAGNLLSTTEVPSAMVGAFAIDPSRHLADRLLFAIEAGVSAGGEEKPVRSAALLIADDQRWPLVDLRVDWDDADPMATLRRLWLDFEPQMGLYVTRALDPAKVPFQG